MRLIKIFSDGKVFNEFLYLMLQDLDLNNNPNFTGAGNEFLKNREWWVIVNDATEIIAYCGHAFGDGGVCIFVRAWVHKNYRGKGLQRKMIRARLKSAKERCSVAITYTMPENFRSSNNLIKTGFSLYEPSYKWAGSGQLYWRKELAA